MIGKTVIRNKCMKHVVSKGCLRASGVSEAPDFQDCSGSHCYILKSMGYTGTARCTLKWLVSLSQGLQFLPAQTLHIFLCSLHAQVRVPCWFHWDCDSDLHFSSLWRLEGFLSYVNFPVNIKGNRGSLSICTPIHCRITWHLYKATANKLPHLSLKQLQRSKDV